MFRLTLLALLFLPTLAFGQTVKLPAEITTSSGAVLIQPEYDSIDKLVDVKWAVLGLKKAPSFTYLEAPFVSKPKSGILVVSPAPGDEITCVVVGLFQNGKMSEPAVTTIKRGTGPTTTVPGTGSTPPATNPTTPTTPTIPNNNPAVDRDIPANASGISAILVVDPTVTQSPDVTALSVGPNAISKALAKGQGAWFVRNSTDSLVTALQPSMAGKQLPVLLVVDAKTNPKTVIGSVSITPTGSVDQTAKKIITQIANAIGP